MATLNEYHSEMHRIIGEHMAFHMPVCIEHGEIIPGVYNTRITFRFEKPDNAADHHLIAQDISAFTGEIEQVGIDVLREKTVESIELLASRVKGTLVGEDVETLTEEEQAAHKAQQLTDRLMQMIGAPTDEQPSEQQKEPARTD